MAKQNVRSGYWGKKARQDRAQDLNKIPNQVWNTHRREWVKVRP